MASATSASTRAGSSAGTSSRRRGLAGRRGSAGSGNGEGGGRAARSPCWPPLSASPGRLQSHRRRQGIRRAREHRRRLRSDEDPALPDLRAVVERRQDVVPPEPPPRDADGDGFETTDVGGDDCNDADDTVHPERSSSAATKSTATATAIPTTAAPPPTPTATASTASTPAAPTATTPTTACIPARSRHATRPTTTATTSSTTSASPTCRSATASISRRSTVSHRAPTTPFTRRRPKNTLDLDQKTLTFAPNAAHTRYTVSTARSSGTTTWRLVPTRRDGDISNCDDCFTSFRSNSPSTSTASITRRSFRARTATSPSVSATTRTTKTSWNSSRMLPASLRSGTISIRTAAYGTIDDEVHYFLGLDKLVVTYQSIQIFLNSGTSNTFQFVLHADGTIVISYNGMDDLDEASLVGITPGSLGTVVCAAPNTECSGTCVNLETNPANCGACGNSAHPEPAPGGCVRAAFNARSREPTALDFAPDPARGTRPACANTCVSAPATAPVTSRTRRATATARAPAIASAPAFTPWRANPARNCVRVPATPRPPPNAAIRHSTSSGRVPSMPRQSPRP